MAGLGPAMHIIVLNSGSNGNAVYVESAASGRGLLLDCGISRRQVEVRLKVHGRTPLNIDGVFVTHEHTDHVRGIPVLTRMYRIPVYLTPATRQGLRAHRPNGKFHCIGLREPVMLADLEVRAFPKSHDARDPVYYSVRCGGKLLLYITDLGTVNDEIGALLADADAVFLESNYDERMLDTGPYPEHLKARIRSGQGHLSNRQAMDLVQRCCNGRTHTLLLGHLSENNNTPEIVRREVDALFARRPDFRPHVHIASRHDVSAVLSV
jgi:phosphoribosyl 1,2-cyclic phosphodiesterase